MSYGIACCRKNTNGQYEILMIKKKSTYAFSEFIRGLYDPNQKQNLIHLFDNMTIDEKISIKINTFEHLWIKNYGSTPDKNKSSFLKGERKYDQLQSINNGVYLNEIIETSTNTELLWEIPKGRSDQKECPIESAIREFTEETNIHKNQYRILFDEGTISYSFIDSGVRYIYIYYIAVMINSRTNPRFSFSSHHMPREVGNIKFLSTDRIKLLNSNRLHKLSKLIIKKVKKYI